MCLCCAHNRVASFAGGAPRGDLAQCVRYGQRIILSQIIQRLENIKRSGELLVHDQEKLERLGKNVDYIFVLKWLLRRVVVHVQVTDRLTGSFCHHALEISHGGDLRTVHR
jgi:hypothetical protein